MSLKSWLKKVTENASEEERKSGKIKAPNGVTIMLTNNESPDQTISRVNKPKKRRVFQVLDKW